ncbi:MAG TPA: hypothetical protein VIP46_02655 [Pyrinomonadaceae bacterium]
MRPQPTEQNSRRARPKLPLLISYAYLREEPSTVERVMSSPDVELLVDSGAFTALNAGSEIVLEDYCSFLHKYHDSIFRYIALDKLMDPEQTDRNLRAMLASGLRPVPVHVLGDDERRMDELFEVSDYVALGGLRRPHRGPAPPSYLKKKMEWAKGRKVHWLGYTWKPMLQALRPFSCDCSSWIGGAMYGRVAIYLGAGKWATFTRPQLLETRAYLREDVRRAVHSYGFTIEQLLDERHWHNGNRKAELKAGDCMITQLPARSWVRYVIDFRLRFGTRFFLACHGTQVPWLTAAYEQVTASGRFEFEDQNFRDDDVRGLPPVEASAAGGRVSQDAS